MNESQKQQELEQKNAQFRWRLEENVDDPLALRKQQRDIEEKQEAFFI
jgi:hypothetical protein